MNSQEVKEMLRKIDRQIRILPRTRKAMLHERLRLKVSEDIVSLMGEQGMYVEVLAKKLGLRNNEMRDWIWTRDLRLSELSRLLDVLDSEFYPIIRSRKLKGSI